LVYGVLTGLRATEVCHSVNLLSSDLEKYYDRTKGLLTHYRYPETFIRNTKKAYISVVTPEILRIGKRHEKPVTYEMLRKALERAELEMHMGYTRKIFGTYLKTQKVDDETIDLLQGRLPKSVFLRFYNRPNFKDEIGNAKLAIMNLNKVLN
jgi:intergrase/recombinase